MNKTTNETKIYKVDSLSTSDYNVAMTSAKNLVSKLSAKYFDTALTVSKFANELAIWSDSSAIFVKSSILCLKAEDMNNSSKVFEALKEKYPYKDKDGKMVVIKTFTKGIKTTEVITRFSESFLNTIVLAYLRNTKPMKIDSKFFSTDAKGNITEVTEETANKSKASNDTAKSAKKTEAETKVKSNERKLHEFIELATEFNNCKKLADYTAILDKYNKIVNS